MTTEKKFLVFWTPTCDACGDDLKERDGMLCPRCKSKMITGIYCQLIELSVHEVNTDVLPPCLESRPATAEDLGKSNLILNIPNEFGGLFSLQFNRTEDSFYVYEVTDPGFDKIRYWVSMNSGI